MLAAIYTVALFAGVGVVAYGALRFFRGDWSASSVEDRPEDSAYDGEDDLDDADIDPVDDEDDYDDEEPWR